MKKGNQSGAVFLNWTGGGHDLDRPNLGAPDLFF